MHLPEQAKGFSDRRYRRSGRKSKQVKSTEKGRRERGFMLNFSLGDSQVDTDSYSTMGPPPPQSHLVRRSCMVGTSHCGVFRCLDWDARQLKAALVELQLFGCSIWPVFVELVRICFWPFVWEISLSGWTIYSFISRNGISVEPFSQVKPFRGWATAPFLWPWIQRKNLPGSIQSGDVEFVWRQGIQCDLPKLSPDPSINFASLRESDQWIEI